MLKNKWFMFSLALFVIPLVLNLVFYNQLPDVVPTHFDVNGQVNGTMPKFMEYIKLDRDKSTFKSHRDFSSEIEITFKHF